MEPIAALPAHGDVLTDQRGEGRAMRLSWYDDGELLVLSLWRGGLCVGTFRLAREDVAALVGSLVTGLVDARPSAPDVRSAS